MIIGGRHCRVLLGLTYLTFSATAWADGGFLSKAGRLAEPVQKAVLLFHDGEEDLILQVKYEGETEDFAWLVPLPSKPEVSVADGGLFKEIEDYVAARKKWHVYSPTGYGGYPMGAGLGGAGAFGRSAEEPAVTVIERKQVGAFDVAVLEAETADDLLRWCTEHGYQVNTWAREVLASYVEKGWIFTAMRIAPEAAGRKTERGLKRGTIDPMRFTFPTREAIYPLRISSINLGPSDITIYTLADDTLLNADFAPDAGPNLREFQLRKFALAAGEETDREAEFAKHFDAERFSFRAIAADELPLTRKSIPRWDETALFLTKQSRNFEPQEMVEDALFRSPGDFTPEEQKALVMNYFGNNTVLLRFPDVLLAQMSNRPAQDAKKDPVEPSGWVVMLDWPFYLADQGHQDLLVPSAQHHDLRVRHALLRKLRYLYFRPEPLTLPYDWVMAMGRCELYHDEFYPVAGGAWPCHQRFSPIPGIPKDMIESLLIEIFHAPEPDPYVARLLADLGTPGAIAHLIGAVRNPLGPGSPHQTQATIALRHTKDSHVLELYKELLSKDRVWLTDNEIAACLVGLWSNLRPDLETLVRQVEADCISGAKPSGRALARSLLVNGLRVEQPELEIGMDLDRVESEMGGKGVLLKRLDALGRDQMPDTRLGVAPGTRPRRANSTQPLTFATGKEIAEYQWGPGVATFEDKKLTKWLATNEQPGPLDSSGARTNMLPAWDAHPYRDSDWDDE